MKAFADELGVDCTSTPFSEKEVDFLVDKLNTPFIKVASMDLNNYPFLEYIAKKGKPIVISTGLSNLNEIDRALSDNKDASKSRNHFLFWLSWVLELEKRFKTKEYCKSRNVPNVPEKCKKYVVWPIWQIIFRIIETKNNLV